jgi:hypothetical protein
MSQRQIKDLAARAGKPGAEARPAAGLVSPMASLVLAILVNPAPATADDELPGSPHTGRA